MRDKVVKISAGRRDPGGQLPIFDLLLMDSLNGYETRLAGVGHVSILILTLK